MKYILPILIIVLLFSCSGDSSQQAYQGYSEGPEGVYYKLLSFDESTRKANYGDYITADIQYLTMKDSVFFSGRRKLQLEPSEAKGSIEACFKMLAEGESAKFIIAANDFFTKTLGTEIPSFIASDGKMKIVLNILEIQTENEYENEKQAFLNWINDFGDYERVLLEQYLKEEKIDVLPTEEGLYYVNLKPGNGKKVAEGDTVTVHYEGWFLNGKIFDSTKRRNQPFQFVYGTEWQVIEGLEDAIGMMSEGERALFILPSDLAFGTEGSSTGIVPPFTSTIFELELIQIN
ncbi:MAG: FKBP-type peptidyl-prolyl cis-trans isomerase [Bacteroidales bacterium]|nr:FKBP-type peptidyl-prolyl cis-trans isomerase [Bacteroidales bacterium]